MRTNEERVQKVLDALLPLRIGARVRVVSCDHRVEAGSIASFLHCAGLYPWMVGTTATIVARDTRPENGVEPPPVVGGYAPDRTALA